MAAASAARAGRRAGDGPGRGMRTQTGQGRRASGGEEARLRRALTLPRNPFARPPEPERARSLLRRPSWRRFLARLAQRVQAAAKAPPPAARAPPWPPDRTPGATGLRNHGNTCFMNAVLQCLSHTDIIAEYFVLDQYKIDLSRRNKLNSKKYGTRGEVTEQLALVLKALWACQYYPELSTSFKAVVERHGTQYRGSSQHDAQEFLLWLLDKVHEDLNTATKKKYKTIKNTAGRPDEVVAAETLANHVRCNSSFVQAVFQAQFRSSLTCPRCNRQSNTFDPFHCMSVQLPHLADHPLLVTVIYVNQQPRCVRLGVRVSASATVRELRTILTNDTGIPFEDIVLVEVTEAGFARTLSDCQPVWGACPGGTYVEDDSLALYCVEAPKLTPPPPTEPPAPYVLLLWVNLLVEGKDVERFGSPYIMQISRETGYEDMQKLLLKEMANMVAPGVLTSRQEPGELKIKLVDPAADRADPDHYLEPEVEHPLFTEGVEQALALCGEKAGPPHLKLLLEWEKPLKDRLLVDCSEACEQHSSVAEVMQTDGLPTRLSLGDCLAHYTRAETLAMEDAWRCPQCQQYLPVVKTLGLWSLPDILVIHLKRFRQQQVKGRNSTKLTTMVDFPLYNFDMTPHLANKDAMPNNQALPGGVGWSPWKRPRKISTPNDNTYDLYAVCYHHGNDLETGHYTAACKNPYDQQWYKFDDTRVTHIENDDVTTDLINNSAYILFYQRRHGNFVGCSSNSSAASTSSIGSNSDHWAARMPKFNYQPKKEPAVENKSSTNQTDEKSVKTDDAVKITNENEEIEMANLRDSVHLRNSTSSLQDNRSDCKKELTTSPTDEKNLRNSISLSDNLRISMTIDSSDVKLDLLEADNLINKDSLYTMGESRRNTLSEYRNTNDEFNANSNEMIHRNSISLTVDPYLHHKDIHVNPKMTSSKTIQNAPDSHTKLNSTTINKINGDCSISNYNFTKFNKPDLSQKISSVRTSLYENSVLEQPSEWLRGEKGYATLRPRQCINNLDTQKEHHSDDEAPPARLDWISPSSLRRPIIFGTSSE